MQYLFNSHGEWIAFRDGKFIYGPSGDILGWLAEDGENVADLETLRKGKKGKSTSQEQDLLRAMLVFAAAGLDAAIKQLTRDATSFTRWTWTREEHTTSVRLHSGIRAVEMKSLDIPALCRTSRRALLRRSRVSSVLRHARIHLVRPG